MVCPGSWTIRETLPRLLQGYPARNSNQHMQIVKALVGINDERAWTALRDDLNGISQGRRFSVLITLGSHGVPEALESAVIGLLTHGNASTRAASARALGRAQPIMEELLPLLGDPDRTAREDVIQILIDHDDARAVPYLREKLDHPNARVRENAREALRRIGSGDAP